MKVARIDIRYEKNTNSVIPVFTHHLEIHEELIEEGIKEPADIILTTPAEAIEFCMSFDGRYATRTKGYVQRWLEDFEVVPKGYKINENTHVPEDWPNIRMGGTT